ncbi:MAG: GTPase HflX [Deltaproteobacteria bacterium]|nr:GTPase HflX [Deltaproteobacteria bacterium]
MKLYGNISGLKGDQVRRLQNLYRRKTDPEYLVSPELARAICVLSKETNRQIGLLIDRQGGIQYVIVGKHQQILLPDDIHKYRIGKGRLKGLRLVHTHLQSELLTQDDLMDLVFLRLDFVSAITVSQDGMPDQIYPAHLLPETSNSMNWEILPAIQHGDLNIDCHKLILSLEEEFAKKGPIQKIEGAERAILISVTTAPKKNALESMAELTELARSSSTYVVDSVVQYRKASPRYLLGKGKLSELVILALQRGANLLIFDQNLNPSQVRSITDMTELKVIDRTQLILDIFARRAHTREGKIQVELAQLKYLLPRLIEKNTAMSRLTGGIGGRGPGETKLEINRRRVHDRIRRLEKQLKTVRKQRAQRRAKRKRKGLPIISIIGYTNAGKSTLLNTLTKSDILTGNRLFATLDPTSRRLKFPRDTEVIITDTVGFIRDLPKDLVVAFRATLEELEDADLLLHVIDISNPRFTQQIESVEQILESLRLNNIATLRVLNKEDLVEKDFAEIKRRQLNAITISAKDTSTLKPLIEAMERRIRNSIHI